MSLAARCIAAIATGVVAADLPGKARAHVERRASAKRRPSTDRHPAVKAANTRKVAAKERVASAKRAMRATVFAWNIGHWVGTRHGACDCGCGYVFGYSTEGECDHWIEKSQGGEHTRENGWRLRSECHLAKTDRKPPLGAGPPTFNERRALYCERAGIPFVHRKEPPHRGGRDAADSAGRGGADAAG